MPQDEMESERREGGSEHIVDGPHLLPSPSFSPFRRARVCFVSGDEEKKEVAVAQIHSRDPSL